MKLVYVCYAALGYAVARWIFQRQSVPVPVMDPVTRFRSSACCKQGEQRARGGGSSRHVFGYVP